MNETIILQNEYATIRHNTQFDYLHHTFHKPISGEPFRSTMNMALDYLRDHHVTKWLSDDRKNAEFTQADVAFAVEDWGPRAAETDWKYWALVVPEDVVARATMTEIVQVFWKFGIKVAFFNNLPEAKNWLQQQ